ncbi:MAG: HEAT repeat domain-containing protein [Verrucomicrobia bacterium]|nr:HEAT repeat domain-containing protein [Verrucomicrobiota bacterium]
MNTDTSRVEPLIPGEAPRRQPRVRASGWVWAVAGLCLAGVLAWAFARGVSPGEREAGEWLKEFEALRSSDAWTGRTLVDNGQSLRELKIRDGTEQRVPERPLSLEGQKALVNRLVRPESAVARLWDQFCKKFPNNWGKSIPRLPLARDQVRVVAPALIELATTVELRRLLLEAALRPKASNRMYALMVANNWPIPLEVLPLLEQLAQSEDPVIRMRVALMLHGIPERTPAVARLLAQLEADQVSVVREAARYSYRSDAEGGIVPEPRH